VRIIIIMSKITLTYFDGRGRGEIIRLLLAYGGADYEDKRIKREDWAALKPSAPFGQVPILEVDGVKLCQSNACARYLARKFHLAGKTELDQARADMLVDCYDDATKPILSFFMEKDETKKAEAKKKYCEEQLPASLALLEGLLVANGGKFFVGSELTWADIAFMNFVQWTAMGGAVNPLEKFPKLTALDAMVKEVPKIKAWIEKRPKTEF
jgi:glutathione S-transferase